MKAYTDIEQSKKLAEILPLESADMHYHYDYDFDELESIPTITEEDNHFVLFPKDVRCWSLAALISSMPRIEHMKPFIDLSPNLDSEEVAIYYHSEVSPYIVKNNLIDACYELILKLHEQKLL